MTTTLYHIKKQVDDDGSYLDSLIRDEISNLDCQLMFLSGNLDDLRDLLFEVLRRLPEGEQGELGC